MWLGLELAAGEGLWGWLVLVLVVLRDGTRGRRLGGSAGLLSQLSLLLGPQTGEYLGVVLLLLVQRQEGRLRTHSWLVAMLVLVWLWLRMTSS